MAKENYKTIELPPKYTPKKSEPYMCPQQLAYFYHLLTAQKEELLQDSDSVLNAVRLADKTESAGVVPACVTAKRACTASSAIRPAPAPCWRIL